jgi:hypothetical protein
MCTYLTEQIKVTGSGKGGDGWFGLTDASVPNRSRCSTTITDTDGSRSSARN